MVSTFVATVVAFLPMVFILVGTKNGRNKVNGC